MYVKPFHSAKENHTPIMNNSIPNSTWNFIKKETLAEVFSCEFSEICKNTFFTEHLRETASK